MATKYLSLYKTLLNAPTVSTIPNQNKRERNFSVDDIYTVKDADCRRVAIVCPASPCLTVAPPSTYIRLWSRTYNRVDRDLSYFRCTVEQLIAGVSCGEISKAIIQRNVIPSHLVETVVSFVEEGKLSFILDLDDHLLAVPKEKDVLNNYGSYREHLRKLMRAAVTVTVSTSSLVEKYAQLCTNIKLVQNSLDDRIWGRVNSLKRTQSHRGVIAMYMGSGTHCEDLDFIIPAFQEAHVRIPHLKLKIIGGFADERSSDKSWLDIVKVPRDYRPYPKFINWLSLQAEDADFGIAPLLNADFNNCKSELKYLEYSGLGLSGIYSKTPQYEKLHDICGIGSLVDNKPDLWANEIVKYARSVERVRNDGLLARKWVETNRFTQSTLDDYDEIILQLLNK